LHRASQPYDGCQLSAGLVVQRKFRSWTAQQQKIEIVQAGLRGDRTVKDVCREHEISDTRCSTSWCDKLLEGGREALAGKEECEHSLHQHRLPNDDR
jgi:transposase-like protein